MAAPAEKKDEEFGISAVALESLERNFVEVMKELSAEDNLERFKLEYEKLHRALKKSHESEKRLIKKCKELNQEIMSNAHSVQSALKLSQDDETTIQSLRKEIEKAWKMVDGAHEKEARAKDTIQQLKKEVARLTTLVEQGAGLTLGQESNLQELLEAKKQLTKDRDAAHSRMMQLTHELKNWSTRVKTTDEDTTKATEQLTKVDEAYTVMRRDFDIEQRKKETSEGKVQEMNKTIEKRTKEAESLKETLRHYTEQHEALDRQLKDEREKVAELSVKYERAQREVQQQTDFLAQIDAQNATQKAELPKRQSELDRKEAEIESLGKSKDRIQRAINQQDREIERLKKERDAEGAKTGGFEQRIEELQGTIEIHRRTIEDKERTVKERTRAKNLTITKGVREEAERVKLEGKKVIESGRNRSLQQELDAHYKENKALQIEIANLEKQQQKYYTSAQEARTKYNQAVEQVKLGKERYAQHNVELQDAKKKLKNQQGMYEQVRADRALYKKSLNDANEEIKEMLSKFKLMDHQIDQLKEELSMKEKQLCTAHAAQKEVAGKIITKEKEVSNLEKDFKDCKESCAKLADEIKQLTQIIADCDTEKAKQQMKFNSVTNERNILATQLIRRNDELALLYEKIRIQQSTLAKGEAQYRERLVDIRVERKNVHELRAALRVKLARIRNVEEMKRHITTLQRQLMHERTKVKALYEELQNPMNVHRWRKLEGSNPQEMDSILKVQTLQKRLIQKTEECMAKDRLIQEKEGQYTELKNILSRQPGPEIAEQLHVYHENIVKRAAQMQRMENELDSSAVQVSEYKYDVQRLNAELLEVKKKFFTLKSKNQLLLREKELTAGGYNTEGGKTFVIHHPVNQPRFAGGGFSLSQ